MISLRNHVGTGKFVALSALMVTDMLFSIRSMQTGWVVSTEQCNPTVDHPKPYVLAVQTTILVVLVMLLFAYVLADMAHDWWTEPAWSQGMLLPPLALYVAWISRGRTLNYPVVPDGRGLLLTSLACITFIMGRLASEFFMTRIAFVILLTGFIWTFWGQKRLRSLGFPLLLLACMVPLPAVLYNSLAAPLQLLASEGATRISQTLGISVFRDGNIIQLAGITLGVAEACSGLSSLSALVVGSLLLGYLLCTHWVGRVLLAAASIPLAIGVNIIRVAGTAVLADINQEFAMGFYHMFSGWLVFVMGFGLLYALAVSIHAFIDSRFSNE